MAAPSPTRFSPSSPLPESQSTIFDNFFPLLLCIAQNEGEYEAVFGFVQGVYGGEGAETIINVWAEPKVFMRGTWKVLADGKSEGVQLLEDEDAEKHHEGIRPPSTSTLTVYPRSKLTFVSRSTYIVLPMPPPPHQNGTGLGSAFGKAQRKEKNKLAWKFER